MFSRRRPALRAEGAAGPQGAAGGLLLARAPPGQARQTCGGDGRGWPSPCLLKPRVSGTAVSPVMRAWGGSLRANMAPAPVAPGHPAPGRPSFRRGSSPAGPACVPSTGHGGGAGAPRDRATRVLDGGGRPIWPLRCPGGPGASLPGARVRGERPQAGWWKGPSGTRRSPVGSRGSRAHPAGPSRGELVSAAGV